MPLSAAHAAYPVLFGITWDSLSQSLQNIVNARHGPGAFTVTTDYIGAHPGDPDPWFWVDKGFSAFIIREVAGNANRNIVGWYKETGSQPVIDGVDDGVVFDGPASRGSPPMLIVLGPTVLWFGFYMNPNGPLGATNAPEPEKFFTNQASNDRGPSGAGAVHAPFDGDVQALVFGASRWSGANTWLVCFEDLDGGANPGPSCGGTDNHFNDCVFEVTAIGATPVQPVSLGSIKARYRWTGPESPPRGPLRKPDGARWLAGDRASLGHAGASRDPAAGLREARQVKGSGHFRRRPRADFGDEGPGGAESPSREGSGRRHGQSPPRLRAWPPGGSSRPGPAMRILDEPFVQAPARGEAGIPRHGAGDRAPAMLGTRCACEGSAPRPSPSPPTFLHVVRRPSAHRRDAGIAAYGSLAP